MTLLLLVIEWLDSFATDRRFCVVCAQINVKIEIIKITAMYTNEKM
jgi:hypothetical protein